MTGTLTHLFIAALAFAGGHFVISETPIRGALMARFGEGPYKGIFSLVMALALAWTIWAFHDAPHVELWTAPIAVKHLPLTLMVIALILVAGAHGGSGDSDGEPKGLQTITRHPMLWGIALWACLHVAANGDAAAVIMFGGFALLALLGTLAVDGKSRRAGGETWQAYAAKTSNVPFAAALAGRTRIDWRGIGWRPVIIGVVLYAVILVFHETLFGVAPASFVSGLF